MKKRFISSFVEAKFLIARCLTLLILALLSANYAWGETVTYQHVFNAKPDTGDGITLSGVKWNISATNLNSYNSANYAGVQIGTGSKSGSITLTSPSSWSYTNKEVTYTKITEIRLWLNTGGGTVTSSVTINGKAASSSGTVTKNSSAGTDWTKASKVTFTPANDGNTGVVVISVEKNAVKEAAGYICALEIDCEEAVTKTLSSIAVKTSPTKTTYNVGEKFAPVGLVITATYDTGDEDIAYAGNESDFSFNPTLTTPLTTSNTSVTITYGGKETTQAITVNKIQLATPTNLQATPAPTSATLTWDAVANASKYEVNINNKTLTAETNSLLVEDLTASTAYTWTVKAKGDNTTYEDSESAESNFTTLAPPSVAYTVTFDGNEHGNPAIGSITEAGAGAGITLPGCTPSEGYQFIGWATSETATEADAGEANATYHPTANITLYAVYKEVYTVTWSINGTSTTEGNPTTSVVEGEGITTLPTTPADISGMSFQGWTATQIAESSATAPTDLFTDAEHAPEITTNTTFYAVFAEKSEGDVTWVKKSVSEISEGGVYAIITTDGHAFNGVVNSGHGQVTTTAFSFTNNVAASAPSGTCEITFEAVTGGFKMYNADKDKGYLYASAASSGKLAWHNTEDSYWYYNSSDNGNWMYKSNSARLRDYSNSSIRTYGANNGDVLAFAKKTQEIIYTYYTNIVVKELTSIELSGNYPTEFWKGGTFNHDGITVTAHYENAEDEDVTEKAEFTGYDMTTVGEQTVTVTYEGKTTTYNITVKNIANTPGTAYTVAEAKALIDANPAELATTNVYVKGTVSKIVTEWSSQYGNITFDVSEDGQTTGDQFQFYRNFKVANKTPWVSAAECPAVGDDVIGYGTLTKFNSTYEFAEGNYIVSLIRAATLSINDITVSLGGTITPEITSNVPETERTITYSVASEDVVKVQDGKLVTVAVGGPVEVTATLTADSYKETTTTFEVTVIKALQSIEVKTAPTTVSYKVGDKFDPAGLVITAKYNDETSEDITYSDETKESFTFEPSLETALTTENTSVTITYAGKEATQTIIVRALYTYDITWMANGEKITTTQVTEGDVLALPGTNPDNIGDMIFQGWINTENYYNAETAPEYIVPETIIPTGAMTFYAVFAKAEDGEPEETEFSFNTDNFTEITTSYTTTFTHTFPEATVEAYGVYKSGGIQMNSGKGTYIKNTTAMPGYISKIVLTWKESGKNSVTMYANANSVASTSSDNLGKQSTTTTTHTINIDDAETKDYKYFYLDGTTVTGACVLTNFSIFYMKATTIYSNYCTKLASADMAITAAKWGTFCAPFAVTIPEGVKAYTADASGSNVAFTEVTTTIPAGIPVVVYSATEVVKNYFGALAEDETCTSGALVGVYAAKSGITAETGYTNYVLQNNTQGVGFYKATSTISLKANRCYMTLPTSSAAKDGFSFEEIITGINEILNPTKKSVEGIFDLNGRKLATPQKGINIINGVKVIVK